MVVSISRVTSDSDVELYDGLLLLIAWLLSRGGIFFLKIMETRYTYACELEFSSIITESTMLNDGGTTDDRFCCYRPDICYMRRYVVSSSRSTR